MNLRDTFLEILDRDGHLDPEAIHDEVADPAHPLHGRYEWDDSVAGRNYRLMQIRSDIRKVVITAISPTTGEPRRLRMFTSLRQAGGIDPVYVTTESVMRDPTAAKILKNECRRAIAELKRKYDSLEDFEELIREGLWGGDG
jgi:hypothetical protein